MCACQEEDEEEGETEAGFCCFMTVNVGVSDYIIWLMSYVCLRSQSGKELEGMCCTWGGCQSGIKKWYLLSSFTAT